jgi:predicted regulator of Ras-like GTPase activity (Roadblock/LC7/MglB family)
MAQRRVSSLSGEYLEAITRRLRELLVEADAAAVVMVDTMGQIIAQAGSAANLDITTMVSLLAASFATTSEMSRQLNETRRTFNLTFHEGERYDIYASNIASGLFLVLVFDRETYAPKIGMVWLYIKRSIQDLLRIVAETETTKPKETLASDFAASLSEELDNLFEERKGPPVQSRRSAEARKADLTRWRKRSRQQPKERKT